MKKILNSLILILISSLFAFILLEIGLRIFYPQQESSRWFESSERYGYWNKTNFSQDLSFPGYDFVMKIQTNSLGHRYKEYNTAEFNDNRYTKVLLLGDSFMFGYGINMEDHIATHIDRQLESSPGLFTVISVGVDGWSTIQEVTYARDNFNVFNPDYVVLLFCGNDPDDDDIFLSEKPDLEKGTIPFPGKIWLRDHSHLYRFVYYRYSILKHNRTLKAKIKENEDLKINVQSGNAITPEQWAKTRKMINDFHADYLEFNEQGVVLVLSTAPWDDEHRQNLGVLSNDTNLFYLDLYDETINLPEEKTKLEYDSHWSELIHRISADKVSDKILEMNGQILVND